MNHLHTRQCSNCNVIHKAFCVTNLTNHTFSHFCKKCLLSIKDKQNYYINVETFINMTDEEFAFSDD